VKLVSTLVNHRSDTTLYPPNDQELPAVYSNGPFYRLITYNGSVPCSFWDVIGVRLTMNSATTLMASHNTVLILVAHALFEECPRSVRLRLVHVARGETQHVCPAYV
jgi:hypothetical protein